MIQKFILNIITERSLSSRRKRGFLLPLVIEAFRDILYICFLHSMLSRSQFTAVALKSIVRIFDRIRLLIGNSFPCSSKEQNLYCIAAVTPQDRDSGVLHPQWLFPVVSCLRLISLGPAAKFKVLSKAIIPDDG